MEYECRYCGSILVKKDNGWVCVYIKCKDKRWPRTVQKEEETYTIETEKETV